MSNAALAEFIRIVSADKSLEAEIETAIAGKQGLEAADAIARVGAKHGYHFTAAEIEEAHESLLLREEIGAIKGGNLGFMEGRW